MTLEEHLATIRRMAPVSFLATLEEGRPRLRAMTHYIDSDGIIWYPSIKRSGKVDQIRANPHAAVGFMDTTWGRAPVTVYGTADIIEDPEVKRRMAGCYGMDIRHIVPVDPSSENFVMIRITPQEIVDNRYERERAQG